jgi:hypothetical protein
MNPASHPSAVLVRACGVVLVHRWVTGLEARALAEVVALRREHARVHGRVAFLTLLDDAAGLVASPTALLESARAAVVAMGPQLVAHAYVVEGGDRLAEAARGRVAAHIHQADLHPRVSISGSVAEGASHVQSRLSELRLGSPSPVELQAAVDALRRRVG